MPGALEDRALGLVREFTPGRIEIEVVRFADDLEEVKVDIREEQSPPVRPRDRERALAQRERGVFQHTGF